MTAGRAMTAAVPRRSARRPHPDQLVATGLALTSVLVLAGAVAQLADYGFGLGAGPLDSSGDGGVFGLVGDVALACAALAAWGVLGRARVRSPLVVALPALLTFLAVDKVLRLHDGIPHWPAYYVPVVVAAFAGLVEVAKHISRRSLRLMSFGVLLLGAALLLHFTGEAVLDKFHASEDGWAVEVKAILKHGAELAGWLIVTLALVLGVYERGSRDTGPTHSKDRAHYLLERYHGTSERPRLLSLYYAVKPLLPRQAQLALRRMYAPRQAARVFPAWPIERILLDLRDEDLRRRLRQTRAPRLPLVGYWPHGRRFAAILTHDVEGPSGIENIPRVVEVERRHGFVSSWNFCAEWYPIPSGVFDALRESGCEIGLHGIAHDGRLFRDRASFEANLPKIHRYMREWCAEGFRSPATHRNADWMPELNCLYDTSFPDTDPFEPQPGGCCSIFPFLIGDLVELPVTLVQDHTLFEILRERSIQRWVEKSEWIIENNGLINLLVHPDYLLTEERLELYEEFLGFLRAQVGGWHALPREVAEWWKERESLECRGNADGGADIVGPRAPVADARVMWAREQDGRIALDHALLAEAQPLRSRC
jgi:hypothetical protein